MAVVLSGTPLGAQPRSGEPDETVPALHSSRPGVPQPDDGRAVPGFGRPARSEIARRLPPTWPRVVIDDVYTREAARRALTGAAEWLAHRSCEAVFTEFADRAGRPLTEALKRLDVTGPEYLRLLLVYDGGRKGPCDEHALAFTAVGSRVIYLCGREFERAWRRDSRRVQAVVIHEALHSLGLPENPPSSASITHRVSALCWR